MTINKIWVWKVLALMLLIVFLPQCQSMRVKREPTTPPEAEQQALEKQREQRTFEESLTAKKYPGIEGTVLESGLLKDIHFEFDRYDLTPEARRILTDNAKVLAANPNLKTQIEGHCDERGSNEYNLALGEKRAVSAKLYLIKLGVKASTLSTISYGEEMPLDPRHNEDAWAQNRRCHFVILSK